MILRRMYGFPKWGWPGAFDELDRMRRQMNRLLEGVSASTPESRAGVFPLINLTEDADNFYLRAELPGVHAGDLEISSTGNNLALTGERKALPEAEGVIYHRRERETGKFSRMVSLPADIDSDQVNAKLVNGVLTVTLPKAAAAKPRRITVS